MVVGRCPVGLLPGRLRAGAGVAAAPAGGAAEALAWGVDRPSVLDAGACCAHRDPTPNATTVTKTASTPRKAATRIALISSGFALLVILWILCPPALVRLNSR